MPTYQYACTACGEQHEAVQTFTDAPLTDCPACGGRLRKVFSAVGVVFKGSGFYKNDSRGSAGKGKDAAAGGDKGEGGSKDGAGKDGGGKDGAAPKKDAPASAPSSSGSGGGTSNGGSGGKSGAGGGTSSGGASAPAAKSA